MLFKVGDIGVVAIHKCGSSTISQIIRDYGSAPSEVDGKTFYQLPIRIGFMRNPYERAWSTYRMYANRGCGFSHNLESFPDFIESICEDQKDDPHVKPQYDQFCWRGIFLPQRMLYWDFEALKEYFPSDKPIPWVFKGAGKADHAWTPASVKVFEKTYQKDIDLWTLHKTTPSTL